jgi:hexosaminidase
MKKLFACLTTLLSAGTLFAAVADEPALIPQPQKLELRPGSFKLTSETKIFADLSSLYTAKQLAATLRPSTDFPFKTQTRFRADKAIDNAILLTTKNANTNLGPEGYELTVADNSVVLRAPTQAGLFYGAQTLLQLLPPKIFSTNTVTNIDWQLPCVQIEDWPRFKWRGLMLDVSRHFFSKH